ncbi:biopolymer transporter Tol [Bacteroidota bacterium]
MTKCSLSDKFFKIIYFQFILFFLNSPIYSQFDNFEPEYNWYTIKGDHIFVHFHEEAERTARVVAKIADEIWEPITSLYQYEPDKVHYVIKDIDDFSNGATFFFDNKIEIWASALDFDLRGTHNWLRNVISHEFTHMVQIQAALKLGRSVPAIYLQFLDYEDIRRPDILYGFPNFIVSYPIATFNVPAWFAEGTAQYMRKEFDYDNWDTHRDMILRCYALDNKLLTWNEMGVFSKTSLGNESVYNSGFALTNYISQKYGEDKLRTITSSLSKLTNFTFDQAAQDVLGKDGQEIYNEWTEFLKSDYLARSKSVIENNISGIKIVKEGFGNFYPTYSQDNSKLFYISNKSEDYFIESGIYQYDMNSGTDKLIVDGVRSTIGVIPGENRIIYAKLSEKNPKWNKIHDLYVYDIDNETEKRLTFGIRANNPSVSHDGKNITFIYQKDGTTNLGIVDISGKNFKRLTFFENGEQVYNPKFAPDDSYIIFDYSYHHTRDIAKINVDGSNFEYLINTENDERNAIIDRNGKVYYSSDETGIFNIFEIDLQTNKKQQITNVLGGAFMPGIDEKGNLFYAGYTSGGYKIFKIPLDEKNNVKESSKYIWKDNPPLGADLPNGDISNFDIDQLRNFNDNIIQDYEKNSYSGFFSRLTLIPFIRFDNYNIANSGLDKVKPGLYVVSSDYLNRYSMFGSIALNKRFERDAFLSFEYRNKLPLLYNLGLTPQLSLELYSVSRKTDVDLIFDSLDVESSTVTTDVTYNLFEVDLAAKHKVFGSGNDLEFRFVYSQYTATLGSFTLPYDQTLIPTSDDKYFVGRNFQFKYTHKRLKAYRDSDINPLGREIELQYNYEFNKYNNEGEYKIEDGLLLPVYNYFNFHRLELKWKEYISLFKGHTINTQVRLGTILGPAVPDFFDFYLGGLIGMKSYPFYAISGNELGWLSISYRFPLLKNLDTRIGNLYIDKIFFSVYGDIGNAWTGDFPEFNDFKKGVGAEIRIKMNSFYLFPTSFFINTAYSFDRFNRVIRGKEVSYGKEWQIYGGILFDFNL